ncbi:MAG: hypothetical protein ACRDZV_16610 [Acidimicrobiia bacterium]
MAVDTNPSRQPNRVRPARDHAPDGAVNTSIAASGGQEYPAGDVDSTPSMRRSGGVTRDRGAWGGPTGTTAGDPPADE